MKLDFVCEVSDAEVFCFLLHKPWLLALICLIGLREHANRQGKQMRGKSENELQSLKSGNQLHWMVRPLLVIKLTRSKSLFTDGSNYKFHTDLHSFTFHLEQINLQSTLGKLFPRLHRTRFKGLNGIPLALTTDWTFKLSCKVVSCNLKLLNFKLLTVHSTGTHYRLSSFVHPGRKLKFLLLTNLKLQTVNCLN